MGLLERFEKFIVDPAIYLVFTAGLLVFMYGLVVFLYKLREGSDHREGVQHMVWGLAGMLIMVSVYGIITLVVNTIGANPKDPDVGRIDNVRVAPDLFTR